MREVSNLKKQGGQEPNNKHHPNFHDAPHVLPGRERQAGVHSQSAYTFAYHESVPCLLVVVGVTNPSLFSFYFVCNQVNSHPLAITLFASPTYRYKIAIDIGMNISQYTKNT